MSTGVGIWREMNRWNYETWYFARAFVVVPSQAIVAKWLESLQQFPISQKPASFNLDDVMAKLSGSGSK